MQDESQSTSQYVRKNGQGGQKAQQKASSKFESKYVEKKEKPYYFNIPQQLSKDMIEQVQGLPYGFTINGFNVYQAQQGVPPLVYCQCTIVLRYNESKKCFANQKIELPSQFNDAIIEEGEQYLLNKKQK